jgi:hypothetical protein
MTDRYRLVFRGEYAPGYNPVDVVTSLEKVFSLPRLRVLGLIARPPVIIRAGLTRQAAERERFAMEEVGFLTSLESDNVEEPPWDGVERRLGERRSSEDRRGKRDGDGRNDRRRGGRRSTDIQDD